VGLLRLLFTEPLANAVVDVFGSGKRATTPLDVTAIYGTCDISGAVLAPADGAFRTYIGFDVANLDEVDFVAKTGLRRLLLSAFVLLIVM
jgi:hypothetical protein